MVSVAGLYARWRSFARDRSGNVALMFGLLTLPLVGTIGAAVDYSRANRVLAQLQAVADAASVGAISKASTGYSLAAGMSGDGVISAAQDDAVKFFNANVTAKGMQDFANLSVTAVVTRKGTTVSSRIDFSAQVKTHFMGIVGKKTMTVGGFAKSANDTPMFIDFHVLLDNTPSMGVAATTNDINVMVNNTPDQCAFACHDLSNSNDYYKLAKNLNVTLRIDVLRTATQQLMDTAKSTAVISNQFRMAIYTFGKDATSPGLRTIQSLTSNLSTAKSAANAIDLMTIPYQNYKSDTITDFGNILTSANTQISNPGSGASSSSPQKYLFFVSDGVADRAVGSPACNEPTSNGQDPQTGTKYLRCQEPLDPAFCTTMKNRGIKIAVLYTTYLPLPTNGWYMDWIAPFSSKISENMQKCASPGFYFEVGPNQGIAEAMAALFKKAVASAHLTQ